MTMLAVETAVPALIESQELAELLCTSELPEGWAMCAMRDVSQVVGGGTPKANDSTNFADDGHPWITPADMSNHRGMYIGSGRRSLSDKGLTTSSATMLPAGAVLFSSRAPIGYVAVASRPVSTNQGFRSFVLEGGLLPDYVYFYLRFAKRLAEQLASGTTFLEISGTNAGRIPIAVPPLAEQRRIVAQVEALLARTSAARERLAKVPAILKRFRQAVLAAACDGRLTNEWRNDSRAVADPDASGELPPTWEWRRGGDLYLEARYGTSLKCDRHPADGVPVLRIPNIVTGQLDLGDVKYAHVAEAELSLLFVHSGDLIVCRTNGSLDVIGKAAVIPELPLPHAFASYLIRLRPKQDELHPKYLHICLSSRIGRDHIEERARTTAGQFNLNLEILRSLIVPLPPVAEQREIVRRVDGLFALAGKIEQRVAAATLRAEKLTQSVLARAFRGELVPTEAELAGREGRDYEPAPILLERISRERAPSRSPRRRAGRGARQLSLLGR